MEESKIWEIPALLLWRWLLQSIEYENQNGFASNSRLEQICKESSSQIKIQNQRAEEGEEEKIRNKWEEWNNNELFVLSDFAGGSNKNK